MGNVAIESIIKPGDNLYAVGPRYHAQQDSKDLEIYSTKIDRIDEHGIALGDDRPVLGFPQWIYQPHDVGFKVHRTAADAIVAFSRAAQVRRDQARCDLSRAEGEIAWASRVKEIDGQATSVMAAANIAEMPFPKRDRKLLAILDAARELADVADSGPQFRANALDALEAAARAWTVERCPICDRRGDHEWEELTNAERLAHEAEAATQGI